MSEVWSDVASATRVRPRQPVPKLRPRVKRKGPTRADRDAAAVWDDPWFDRSRAQQRDQMQALMLSQMAMQNQSNQQMVRIYNNHQLFGPGLGAMGLGGLLGGLGR